MKIIVLMLLLAHHYAAAAQEKAPAIPIVGEPCPEFTLNDVLYHKSKSINLTDFRGKWLVMDFWNRYCSICLNKMPHLDSLQKRMAPISVQFLLVGYIGSQYTKRSDNKLIRALYDRNRIEKKLQLSIAFDSLLFHQFKIGPCPYIIIVDPQGVVRALTSNITEDELNAVILGRPVKLEKVYGRKIN